MEYKELKEMPLAQLNKKAQELKKNLFELRMKNAIGQLGNPLEIRSARRAVAKALTAIRNQAFAAPEAPKATKTVKAKAKTGKTTKAKKAKKK